MNPKKIIMEQNEDGTYKVVLNELEVVSNGQHYLADTIYHRVYIEFSCGTVFPCTYQVLNSTNNNNEIFEMHVNDILTKDNNK